MSHSANHDTPGSTVPAPRAKKAWSQPVIRVASVKQVTKGGPNTGNDGGGRS